MSPWQQCEPVPNATEPGVVGQRGSGMGRAAEGCGTVSVAIPLTMMITGMVGNGLAMLLVSRSYRAKGSRRKRSFLLCIGSLAITDMLGQLLTSPIVISVYLANRTWEAVDPSGHLCVFFGFSMTVFGLCPLLIASAMAVERALAIRAPHWYASHMNPRLTKGGLLAIWTAVVAFALLPVAGLGQYTLQWPGTWCFISTGDGRPGGSTVFAATFAVLGLLSLVVTVACNLATIEALVSRCRTKATEAHSSKQWGRITMETLIQLLGIMCVLSACWSPLLITMLKIIWGHTFEHCKGVPGEAPGSELHRECNFFLTAVRLASLNQILDPWVYLLLRKILLQKFCQAANAVSKCSNTECKERSITLSEEIRRTTA